MALNYNYITSYSSPNYWAGGNTITSITIHWWDDPKNQPSAEGVVSWLCNPASQVSAHIVATGTGRRVWQLVNDRDRAWHGGTQANASSLGLELDPRCRDEDYDVAAEVIANLWRFYGRLPLVPHNRWVGTRCPGNYDLARLEREADAKLNPKPAPKPTPAPKPVSKQVPAAQLLGKVVEYRTKLDKTEVWDLTTNPNYKSTKTLGKGEKFEAYAVINFNNTNYYVTEYSYKKGWKHGVNQNDLVKVEATPVPTPTPEPTPKPEPTPTPETPEPIETPNPTLPPTPEEPEDPKGEELPVYRDYENLNALASELNKQASQFMKSNEFEPVISERVKTVTYFVTDLTVYISTFVLTILALIGTMDGNMAIYINAAVIALMTGVKQTFRLSSKKSK